MAQWGEGQIAALIANAHRGEVAAADAVNAQPGTKRSRQSVRRQLSRLRARGAAPPAKVRPGMSDRGRQAALEARRGWPEVSSDPRKQDAAFQHAVFCALLNEVRP